jgi:hypothetical protein
MGRALLAVQYTNLGSVSEAILQSDLVGSSYLYIIIMISLIVAIYVYDTDSKYNKVRGKHHTISILRSLSNAPVVP